MDQLVGYVDAVYTDCLRTHRSLGVEVFCLAGATNFYREKLILVIYTSSTEAECVVCVRAGKLAQYLRLILNELGIAQVGLPK
jgi:hypothetical protein